MTPAAARTMREVVADCPCFAGLSDAQLRTLAGCAANVAFAAEEMIFREGGAADAFYLLRHGDVSLELRVPGRSSALVQTLRPGDVLGWSWLFEPYRWHFDARARTPVRATAFDASCLRRKVAADHEFGYQLMQRFAAIMLERLQAARLQLLDLYGDGA